MENIYEAVRRALVDALVPEIKQMQGQLAVLTERVDALGARLDRVEDRLDRLDSRLGNVEQLLASLNAKFDAALDVRERLAAQEARVALLEARTR